MKTRVMVLGAGFGGLELCTSLSEAVGDQVEVTLIDKSEFSSSVFEARCDVRALLCRERAVALSQLCEAGGSLRAGDGPAIDPVSRRVTTDGGSYDADFLVIALGADYDMDATPGLAEGGNEFYTVAGAERVRDLLPSFTSGRAIIGASGAPFKCPPAPSECALLLHDYLEKKGVRGQCEITMVLPWGRPVPPSPETSEALLKAFAERGITFIGDHRVVSLDPGRRVAVLDDGKELAYDLFLGIPKHCAPKVVQRSGIPLENGYVAVNPRTLETKFPGVYAIGDIAFTKIPRRACLLRAELALWPRH